MEKTADATPPNTRSSTFINREPVHPKEPWKRAAAPATPPGPNINMRNITHSTTTYYYYYILHTCLHPACLLATTGWRKEQGGARRGQEDDGPVLNYN
eukprot:scaffold1597_cov198-Isochrysis_galbana.AAC.2